VTDRRRRQVALLLAAFAAAVVAGCGVPTDSSPRPLDDVPFGLVAPPTTVPANVPTPSGSTVTAVLYFISGSRLVMEEAAVPKASNPQDQARLVLDALTAGPRENSPLFTALRSDANLGVSLRGSLATVELGQAVENLLPEDQLFAIGQIVLSLTRVSPIIEVDFTQNGVPVSVFLPGEPLASTDEPVRASNYLPLLTTGAPG
jgi:spore germination protein GerM